MNQFSRRGLRLLTGVCSLFLTLHGIYSLYGLDLRRDRVVSSLYVLFQLTSFLVFLGVKRSKAQLILHAVNFSGYLLTYSLLNWRNCAELAYCASPASTVLETLRTIPVGAALAVFLLSACAVFFSREQGRGSVVA